MDTRSWEKTKVKIGQYIRYDALLEGKYHDRGPTMKKEYLEPTITLISFVVDKSIASYSFASDGDILIDTDDL